MKRCQKCNIIFSDDKKYCRNCGIELSDDKVNLKFMKFVMIGLVIIVIFCFFNNIKSSNESARETARLSRSYNDNNTVSTYDLKITNQYTYCRGDYTYIEGSVKNTGDYTASYYKITAKFYNKYTKEIEDSDYTNSAEDLAPGESRKFEIMTKGTYGKEQIQLYINEAR